MHLTRKQKMGMTCLLDCIQEIFIRFHCDNNYKILGRSLLGPNITIKMVQLITVSLKPETFEGMRFDFNKMLNQKFLLSHSVFMGPMELPSQSAEVIKIPTSHYEFGANFIDQQKMFVGRIMTDGRLNLRIKQDITDNLAFKLNGSLSSEPHMSQGIGNLDYKGKDWRGQFQFGSGTLFGANYVQSVTPHLALGSEVFWAGQQRKSGLGIAARYNTDKMVFTGQIATTGMVSLTYVQKVSEKVNLATDFMYNSMSRDATASVGYDYMLRQAILKETLASEKLVLGMLKDDAERKYVLCYVC